MKKSQLFCKTVPDNILYDFIGKVSTLQTSDISGVTRNFYKIDKIIFKKLEFHNLIKNFLEEIKQYYFTNKHYYIERDITYNNFLTIVRQLCKYNNIDFKKEIVYEKDTYSIEYYIFAKI